MRQALFIYLALAASILGIVLLFLLVPADAPLPELERVVKPAVGLPAPPPDSDRPRPGHGTLRGKVVDGRDGRPLEDALIEALMPYERKVEGEELPMWGSLRVHKRVRTGADGTFAVEDLPPNYWNLWVERRGYAWTTVPRAKFDETHVIELFPACSVYGRVVYPDGSPAEGVRIEYTPQGTHSEVFGRYASKGLESHYTTTKEDGTFEYTGLPPGGFTVEVYPENHLPAPWIHEPPLKAGENRDLGTHKLDAGFSMEVHVKWRGTNEGVPGIEVVIRPVGDPMPRTKIGQRRRTDPAGVARFQGLGGQVMPNPKFMVAANVDGVGPVQPDQAGLLEPGKTVTIYLRKDGIVKGKVVGPDGEDLPSFFVDLKPLHHRTRQLRVSGQQGVFTMYGVPEGEYEAHIRHKDFIDAVRRVTAIGGEETDLGVVTLRNGAEIYGTVRRSGGEPLEGVVQVRLARKLANGWEEIARDAARADGTYRIRGVPEGTWYLQPDDVRNPSSVTDPVRVVVRPGTGGIQKDLVLYGDSFLTLKFFDLVEGQERHVHAPPTTLVEERTGKEIRWLGEGTRLRSGRYAVYVQIPDNEGVPQRYRVTSVRVQEGAKPDPIEIRLYEIRDGGQPEKDTDDD